MATVRQIEANRRNAQRSTGPTTAEGKNKARYNAVKHGLTAASAVLPHEDPNTFQQLRDALIESYAPATPAELMLVDMVAHSYWRLLRARRVERASLALHIEALKQRNDLPTTPDLDDDAGIAAAFDDPNNNFVLMDRYQNNVERSYYRALEALRKCQNDRLRNERHQAAQAKIGSVSHSVEAVASASAPVSMPAQLSEAAPTFVHTADRPLNSAGLHLLKLPSAA